MAFEMYSYRSKQLLTMPALRCLRDYRTSKMTLIVGTDFMSLSIDARSHHGGTSSS